CSGEKQSGAIPRRRSPAQAPVRDRSIELDAPSRGALRAGRFARTRAAVLGRLDLARLAIEVVAAPGADPLDQRLARELPLAADLAARDALRVEDLVEGLHADAEQLGRFLDRQHVAPLVAHRFAPSRAHRAFISDSIHVAISSVGVPGPNRRAKPI